MKIIKILGFLFIAIIAVSVMIGSCNGSSDKEDVSSSKKDVSPSKEVEASAEAPDISPQNWQYSEQEDKMTSKKSYFASVEAKELLQFKFPYDGGSTATLVLRNIAGENNVYVTVSKGQMLTKSYQSTAYRVRFDDKPLQKYNFVGPSDGSSTMAFIDDNTSKFIKNLKGAKKVIVEIEFFRGGSHPIEFDVSNLKWNH